ASVQSKRSDGRLFSFMMITRSFQRFTERLRQYAPLYRKRMPIACLTSVTKGRSKLENVSSSDCRSFFPWPAVTGWPHHATLIISKTWRLTMKNRIFLLYGGKSAEHEVSLSTARAVTHALDFGRYD